MVVHDGGVVNVGRHRRLMRQNNPKSSAARFLSLSKDTSVAVGFL